MFLDEVNLFFFFFFFFFFTTNKKAKKKKKKSISVQINSNMILLKEGKEKN